MVCKLLMMVFYCNCIGIVGGYILGNVGIVDSNNRI